MNHRADLSEPTTLSGDLDSCARILAKLHTVVDSEAARSVVDMGLISRVHAEPGIIEVFVRSNCQTCQTGHRFLDDVFVAVRAMAPVDTDIYVLPADRPVWESVHLDYGKARAKPCNKPVCK